MPKCIHCKEQLVPRDRPRVRQAEKDYRAGLLTEDEWGDILERARLEARVCFKSDSGRHTAG